MRNHSPGQTSFLKLRDPIYFQVFTLSFPSSQGARDRSFLNSGKWVHGGPHPRSTTAANHSCALPALSRPTSVTHGLTLTHTATFASKAKEASFPKLNTLKTTLRICDRFVRREPAAQFLPSRRLCILSIDVDRIAIFPFSSFFDRLIQLHHT